MSLPGPLELLPSAAPDVEAVAIPDPIGPLTSCTAALLADPGHHPGVEDMVRVDAADALDDLDFQRSLFLLHQLHDRGVAGAHDDAEWHPVAVEWWHRLAGRFETALMAEVEVPTIVLGPIVPVLGSIARRSTTVSGGGRQRDPETWDGPMHRIEVRRHPLAHAQVAAAARLASTCAPTVDAAWSRPPLDVDSLGVEMLAACNLTSHLALHRRLLPALLGHLAWHEMTGPADPFAGPTHVAVAHAFLTEHVDDRPLAVWGADVSAVLEQRLADASVPAP